MEKKTETKEKISKPEQLAIHIKSNKVVVIKISASWCGPCKNKQFLGEYHNLKNAWASIPGVKFIELDVDADESILSDKSYYDIEVDSVPSFLISKNGSFTRKYSGTNYLESIHKYITESISTSGN
jgi:thiol-disulfide isomerase/thioredoxin